MGNFIFIAILIIEGEAMWIDLALWIERPILKLWLKDRETLKLKFISQNHAETESM